MKIGSRTLILADYGRESEAHELASSMRADLRLHPAVNSPQEPLETVLPRYQNAVGYAGSAVVTAAIYCRNITCRDSSSPAWHLASGLVSREQWLNNLSYAQYSAHEVRTGIAWDFLCHSH
jgi:hypothetical protein